MIATTPVPGTSRYIGLPAGWHISSGPGAGLIAIEQTAGGFAANLTILLDTTPRGPLSQTIAAVTAPLLAPVLVDVHSRDDGFDLVLCHLVGSVSVTARQRQVVVEEGLLILTFTAATSRWAELRGLAEGVLESMGAAA